MISANQRARIQAEVECRVIDMSVNCCRIKRSWKEYIIALDHWMGYYLNSHSREVPRMPSFQLPKVEVSVMFKGE